jgi:MFS family permease
LGFSVAFITAGLITALILIFSLCVKEVKIFKKRQKVAKILINEFKKRSTQLLAILGPIIGISVGLLMIVVPLYLYSSTSLQLDIVQIGLITSVFPISTIFGALIAGPISDKWDRKIILYILILVGIFFSASLVFAYTWLILAIIYDILGFVRGGYYVVLCAIFMDVTNPRVGATQFSILTSLTNFGLIGIGFVITGSLVAMLGFGRIFLFTAWFLGPAILVLYFVRIKHQKSKSSD